MKKVLMIFILVMATRANAQLIVKVNGKPITDKQIIKAEDIKKLEIGFDKPKKLNYGQGKVVFLVDLNRSDDNYNVESYLMVKSGANAVEAFLSDVNIFYLLYEEGNKQNDFQVQTDFWDKDNSLAKTLKNKASIVVKKNMKMTISLYFKDKTGYNSYGDAVNLVQPFTINIDNSANVAMVPTPLKNDHEMLVRK